MSSVASLIRPCLITSRDVHEARLPRICSRLCPFEVKKTKKNTKSHQTLKKTHHEAYPSQPGDRDHLETACSETRPTRGPMLALFLQKSWVCGNQPRLNTHGCIYSHSCCRCAACVRAGALYFSLASAASSFSAVILVCMSGCGVVRWCLTLSFS